MGFQKAAWLFAALAVLTWPAEAQFQRRDSGLYIRGNVRAEPNRYVEDVRVDLKRETGQVLHSVYTRFNGQFEFFGLSVGIYVLEIEVDGFQPVRQVVAVDSPPGVNGVTLMLRPTGGKAGGATGRISTRELAIPARALAHFNQGEEQLRQKKNPGGAVSDLKEAVKIFPDYFEAHHLLGVAYMEMGKTKEAEEALRKSIEVSKESYGPAFAGLAALLSDQQKFAEAEPLARNAVERQERAWQGHFEMGRALLGLERAGEAEPSARRAVEINPGLTNGFLLLAKIHQALGNYPAMLSDLDEFLRREPKSPRSSELRKTRAQLAKALRDAGMEVPAEPPSH